MQDPHPVDQTLSALKAMSWTASLPFKGHFCHATDDFNASLEPSMTSFSTLLLCTKVPSTLFGPS